ITSEWLLRSGVAKRVTGIELSKSVVEHSLLMNPRFQLIVGDVTRVASYGYNDVCVYGAVHHHILHEYGLDTAIRTLKYLAKSTRSTIFFETGQLCEIGRWPWQRTLRRYFSSDEAHFNYLLASIEDRVADIKVIGRYWIHGVR